MLIFGGTDGKISFNDLHVLDLEKQEWTELVGKTDEVPLGRVGHVSFVSRGSLYVIGGYDYETGEEAEEILEFSIESQSWKIHKTENKIKGKNIVGIKTGQKIKLFSGIDSTKESAYLISEINNKTEKRVVEKKKVEKLVVYSKLFKEKGGIKDMFEESIKYGEEKDEELIKMKDELITKIMDDEFNRFYKTPTEEVLYETMFIKYMNMMVINFPLFIEETKKKEEKKRWNIFKLVW